MSRFVLLSDTHGNLDIINELVEKTCADYVIHAGDFGFYNQGSLQKLSARELYLLIVHSPFGRTYEISKQLPKEQLAEIVDKHKLLGDFTDYFANKKQFKVPVYAVWGNHEDAYVIKQLISKNPVTNLYLLDSNHYYSITEQSEKPLSLFGLGGNFLPSKKMLQQPIAGQGGKVWMTLHEIGTLYRQIQISSQPSIFVSHVSPGKEPLLTRIISHFMPNIWISGHMGAPFTCTWNQFTIRELDEALAWIGINTTTLDEKIKLDALTEEAKIGYALLKRNVTQNTTWFKNLWNINLTDAKDGYAILDYTAGRISLQTFSKGIYV